MKGHHPATCNPIPVLRHNDASLDYSSMEMKLAREMARMKSAAEQRKRELMVMAAQSDDVKNLKAEIDAAKMNKMRAA
jgi:hypothetical protein